jgi:ABC-type branched-subunit amino acid transport system substrate-binding protein
VFAINARFSPWLQASISAAVLSAGLLLAGCSSGPRTPPPVATTPPPGALPGTGPRLPPGAPVTAALLLPLSGERANLGTSMQRAAQMAAAQSGVPNLQIVSFDTRGTPEGAAEAADRAIAGNANIILGPLLSGEVRAVRERAAAARVNVIAFSNDAAVAGGNVFLLSFLPKQQVENVIAHAAREGRTRIAVLAPQNAYGEQILNYAREVAPRYNATVVKTGFYNAESMEVTDDVKAFSGAAGVDKKGNVARVEPVNFDAVLIPDGGTKLRMVASLLAYYDVDPDKVRYLGTGRWDDRALRRESMLRGGWFAAPHPGLWEQFAAKYKQAHAADPPRVASLAHDAVVVTATLARRREGADFSTAAIADPQGFTGADGPFRFLPDGTSERGLAVIEINRDEFRVVGEPPRSFAVPGMH